MATRKILHKRVDEAIISLLSLKRMMQFGLKFSTKTIRISRFNGAAQLISVCYPKASTDRTRCRSPARLPYPAREETPAACTCSRARCTRRSILRVATNISTDDLVSTTTLMRWLMTVCWRLDRRSMECLTRMLTASLFGWDRSSIDARMCEAAP